MSVDQFLDKLEEQGLLETQVIKNLRKQVAQATSGVSPQTIAKLLIDKGQITPFQAKKILASSGKAKPVPGGSELELAAAGGEPKEEVVDLAPADKSTPPPPPTKKRKSKGPPAAPKTRSTPTQQTSQPPTDLAPLDDSDLVSMDDAVVGGLGPMLTYLSTPR